MKALSINQPWAWTIFHGGKRIENRKWKTNFRGEFLIHAGQRFDHDGLLWIARNFPELELIQCVSDGFVNEKEAFPRGGILGRATVIDCVKESGSPWFFGPYGFVLSNIKQIDFIPCNGMLNFFTPKFPEKTYLCKKCNKK